MVRNRRSRLPLNGIITDDGHYFHHTFLDSLIEEERQALMEHGLDCGYRIKFFSKEEDNLIRQNWKSFAEKHGIGLEHVGIVFREKDRDEHKKLFQHVDFTNFWPMMCKGLPNRTAWHVRYRMEDIFDPAIISGSDKLLYGVPSPSLALTDKELNKIDHLRATNIRWEQIGKILDKSMRRCRCEHANWIRLNNQVSRKLWMKLFDCVNVQSNNDVTNHLNSSTLLEMIKAYCFAEDSSVLDTILESLDVSYQAKSLGTTEQAVRNTWKTMLENLRSYICEEKKKQDVLPDEILFIRAVNENIRYAKLVSFKQLAEFLKILIKATPADQLYSSFTRKLYNIPSLEAEMKQRAITGFYSGNESEFWFLYKTVRNILFRCQKIVFSLFHRHYSVKERLVILLETLELQWTLLHENIDKSSAKRVDFSEYNEKNHVMTRNYIYVKTLYFLDALVSFTVRKDPKWIPPTKLQNYMIRPETKTLFPKKKNNSALVEKKRSKRDSE